MFGIRSFGQIAFQLLGTGLCGLTVYIVGNIVIRPQTTNALLNICFTALEYRRNKFHNLIFVNIVY